MGKKTKRDKRAEAILRLLRRIDRKLAKLVSSSGVAN